METGVTSLAKFMDDAEWAHVDKDVPIFMEHTLYEVDHPYQKGERITIAVLPGEDPPDKEQNPVLLYSIGPAELVETAKKINGALKTTGNAVKLFLGSHSKAGKPHTEQPPIVGYGVGAKCGRFGPGNIRAVLANRLCYSKGTYEDRQEVKDGKTVTIEGAKNFPERSPEFKPLTGNLTGLALLKTDPKLPMGMMTYQAEDTVFYAADFLGKKKVKEGEEEEELGGEEEEEGEEEVAAGEQEEGKKALPPDPTEPPTTEELPQEHRDLAEKYMAHYKQHDPLMRYMCGKYESEAAAASAPPVEPVEPNGAAGGPMNGAIPGANKPGEKPGEKKPPEKKPAATPAPKETENMSDTLTVQYQQLALKVDTVVKENKTLASKVDQLARSNAEKDVKYAESEGRRIVQGLVSEGFEIKSPQKLLDKLKKADDAGRKAIVEEVRENYQQIAGDPTRNPFIDVFDGPVEGGEEDDAFEEKHIAEAVHYAEEHKLDPEDPRQWEKCMKAVVEASKNGKAKK